MAQQNLRDTLKGIRNGTITVTRDAQETPKIQTVQDGTEKQNRRELQKYMNSLVRQQDILANQDPIVNRVPKPQVVSGLRLPTANDTVSAPQASYAPVASGQDPNEMARKTSDITFRNQQRDAASEAYQAQKEARYAEDEEERYAAGQRAVAAEDAMETARQRQQANAGSQWMLDRAKQYAGISSEPDYQTASKPDENIGGATAVYRYINNVDGFADGVKSRRTPQFGTMRMPGEGDPYELYDYLTDEERGSYTYIYNKQGAKAAAAYLDYISYNLNERKASAAYTNAQNYATLHPVMASAESVPGNVFGGIQGILNLTFQQARNTAKNSDRPLDFNTGAMITANVPNVVRTQVSQDIAEKHPAEIFGTSAASFLYQTGMSIADSAVILGLSMLGVPGTTALLGGSAATQAAIDSKNRGATDGQALGYGIAAGIAETLFEKVSLEQIIKPTARGFAAGLRNVLRQSFTEASEEVVTTLANTLSDAVINSDRSELQTTIRQLMESGMSEEDATKAAWSQWWQGLAGDFLGGFISGGVMSGAKVAGVNILGAVNDARTAAAKTREQVVSPQAQPVVNPVPTVTNPQTTPEAVVNPVVNGRDVVVNQQETRTESEEQTIQLPTVPGTALQNAVNTLRNGGELSGNAARRVLQDAESMKTLRDAGVLAETVRPGAEGRQQVADAVRQYAAMQNTSESEGSQNAPENAQRTREEVLRDMAQRVRNGEKITEEQAASELTGAAQNRTMDASNKTEGANINEENRAAEIPEAGREADYAGTAGEETTEGRADTGGRAARGTDVADAGGVRKVSGDAARRFLRNYAEERSYTRQRHRADEIRSAAAAAGLRQVSTNEMGVPHGTDTRSNAELTRDIMTRQMRKKQDELKAQGINAHFVIGLMETSDNGDTVLSRGAVNDEGTEMWITANHPRLSWNMIADHEFFHAMKSRDPGIVDRTRKELLSDPKMEGKFKELVDRYTELYRPLGYSPELILEELLADYYAGYDATELLDADRDTAKAVRSEVVKQYQTNGDKPAPADVNPDFAEARFSIEPPYKRNTKAEKAFYDGLSEEAKKTYNLFKSVHSFGEANKVTMMVGSGKKAHPAPVNITMRYMTVQEWNRNVRETPGFAEAAKGLYEMLGNLDSMAVEQGGTKGSTVDIPAGEYVRFAARFSPDGTFMESKQDESLKIESAFIQRVIDSLPERKSDAVIRIGGKDVRVTKPDKYMAIGGNDYRRAIIDTRRQMFMDGTLPFRSISALSKDNWGAMGFLAANGKTGASGDFTTFCPQMMFNNGCFYCYRLSALTTGVNNKLTGRNVWYAGEILQLKPSDVKMLNANGGLRIQSFGDWMDQYSEELADMLIDADMKGLQIKIITKEPTMIEAVALLKSQGIGKNLYFNLSADYTLEMSGKIENQGNESVSPRNPNRPQVDIGGTTWWKRAMTVQEAAYFRATYPWVNTRIVATNVEEFVRGLRSPYVDVVTGYHGSIRDQVRISSETGEMLLEVEAIGDAGMPRFGIRMPDGTTYGVKNPAKMSAKALAALELDPSKQGQYERVKGDDRDLTSLEQALGLLGKGGEWVTTYSGKTSKHKELAERIQQEGLQMAYFAKVCCQTGRCSTCAGKCGLLAQDPILKNLTNRDIDSLDFLGVNDSERAWWLDHLYSTRENILLDIDNGKTEFEGAEDAGITLPESVPKNMSDRSMQQLRESGVYDPDAEWVTNGKRKKDSGTRLSMEVESEELSDMTDDSRSAEVSSVRFSREVTPEDTVTMADGSVENLLSRLKQAEKEGVVSFSDVKEGDQKGVVKVFRAMQAVPLYENGKPFEEKFSVQRIVSYDPLIVEAKVFTGKGKNRRVETVTVPAGLFSPMAGKYNGEWRGQIYLDKWEMSEGHPERATMIIDEETGEPKIDMDKNNASYGEIAYSYGLEKGGVDDNGKKKGDVPARYNPYTHTSLSALNDQFSSGNNRPELITVETLVPVFHINNGKNNERLPLAKDRVGAMSWHSGPTSSRLSHAGNPRVVILSRYDKPIRVVPDSEVAKSIKDFLGDTPEIAIYGDTVTPSLAKELEALGVDVLYGDDWEKYTKTHPVKYFDRFRSGNLKSREFGTELALPYRGGLGDYNSGGRTTGGRKVSRVRSNALEVSNFFNGVEAQMDGMRPEDYTYDPVAEKATIATAKERIAIDAPGWAYKLTMEDRQWDGKDVDTAMGILYLYRQEARMTGDYSRVIDFSHVIQRHGTRGGQEIQAFAKYSRTATYQAQKAAANIEKENELNPAEKRRLKRWVDATEEGIKEAEGDAAEGAVDDAGSGAEPAPEAPAKKGKKKPGGKKKAGAEDGNSESGKRKVNPAKRKKARAAEGILARADDRYQKSHGVPVEDWTKEAGKELAKKLSSRITPKTHTQTVMQTIVGDLVKFGSEYVAQRNGTSEKRTAAEMIVDYFNNRWAYGEAWATAKDILRQQYKNDPEKLDLLEGFLNGSVGYNADQGRLDRTMIDAIMMVADGIGMTEAEIEKLGAVGARNTAVDRITEAVMQEIGEGIDEESDLTIIRDAVRRHINDIIMEDSENRNARIQRLINEADNDMGLKLPTAKSGVSEGLKTELMDVILESDRSKAGITAAVAKHLTDKLGLNGADAAIAAQVIAERYTDRIAAAADAKLKKMFLPDETGKPITKEQRDKLIDLARLHGFDNQSVEDAVADALGLGKVSREEQRRVMNDMMRFADTIDNMEDGDIGAIRSLILEMAAARNTKLSKGVEKFLTSGEQNFEYLKGVAMAQLSAIGADYAGASTLKKISTVQTMSHLMNLRTGLRNVVSNQTFDPVETIANDVALLPDFLISRFTGAKTVGLEKSWASRSKRIGAIQGMKRGALETDLDIAVDSRDPGKYYTRGRRSFNMVNSSVFQKALSRLERIMGYELNVTDEFLKGSVRSETIESLQGAVDNGYITEEEAVNWAVQEALYRSFQDDTYFGFVFSSVKKFLNSLSAERIKDPVTGKTKRGETPEFGLGDLLVKYTQVPGALIHRAIEFSPLGYMKAIHSLIQTGKLNKQGYIHLNEANDKGNYARAAQRMGALAIGRATTGTGLIIAFAVLARLGILKRPDDKDDKNKAAQETAQGISGTQINSDALLRLIKGEDTAMQDGDLLLAAGFLEPLNSTMTMGVELAKDDQWWKNIGDASLTGIWAALRDTSVMEALNDLIDTVRYMSDEDRQNPVELLKTIGQETISNAATGFIPGPVRQLAQAIDTTYREQYGTKEWSDQIVAQFMNSLPTERKKLNPKITPLGEEKTYEGRVLNVLNAAILPGNANRYRANEVTDELNRLYSETGKAVWPERNAPYKADLKDEDGAKTPVTLTGDERMEYQKTRGTATSNMISLMMGQEWYRDLSVQEQANAALFAKGFADYLAKVELAEERGMEFSNTDYNKYYSMLENGTKLEDILRMRTGYKALEPEPGKASVSAYQKWQNIVDTVTGEAQQADAMKLYMSDSQKTAFDIAMDNGVTPSEWAGYYSSRSEYDADGNGSYKQEETQNAIEAYFGSASDYKKGILWQLLTGSTSTKNNPYSKDAGQKVLDAKAGIKTLKLPTE